MTSTPRTPARGTPAVPAVTRPTVGGYTLLTKIGEGGMGVVHLARRGDGERVALKVLRPHIVGDDEARRRLEREVGSLSRIRSKWVAEIVDADPWAPVPYVATRYVPGLSLHDYVHEEGPIKGKDLTWFAACLAEGLASVHAVGVLHRDVKPSNVLMEGRTPILIDFGLARVADDPKLTHTGWLLGTPGYLAPEILHGDDATDGLRRALVGGDRRVRRDRQAAVRPRAVDGDHGPRPPRRAPPLRHPRAAAPAPRRLPPPRRRAAADAGRDPGLAAAAGRSHAADGGPAAAPDKLTMPYAAARTSPDARSTDVLPGGPPVGADGTKTLTEHQTVMERDPRALPLRRSARQQGRPPFAERARRATLLVVGALLCGGIVAAYPWYGSVTLLLLVWLLRSGSLAASAAGDRRRVRGPKWYDGAQLLVRAPWSCSARWPGPYAPALERRARGRRGAALLRVRRRRDGDALRLRRRLRGRGVDRPRGLPRAVTAVARGEPGRSPVEAVAGRHLRPARAGHRSRRARRVARHVVVARRGPSAERTDQRTAVSDRGRMGRAR